MEGDNITMEKNPMEDWGRHFDILFWTVTTIMATAIGGLLVVCSNNNKLFDPGLAILGFSLTIIAVYFAESFRRLRHNAETYYARIKSILDNQKLYQWGAYRLVFVIFIILYAKLLFEHCNCFFLKFLCAIAGIIGVVVIIKIKKVSSFLSEASKILCE